jgi:predicted SnoaL-like aldol condensation-catalyzing enzyme
MTNKELIIKFYDEVFNNWDTSNLDFYMKDDYKQHNPTVPDGKDGFLKFCEKFLAMKPHMDIYHILEDGDMVLCFLQMHHGANQMVNKVFDMYRIEDGKLAEHWDCVEHDIKEENSVNPNGYF